MMIRVGIDVVYLLVFLIELALLMFLMVRCYSIFFFFSSRRRHTRCLSDWSSDVCSSDLYTGSFAGIFVCMIALFGCAGRRPVISSAPPVVNPAPAPELTPEPAPTQPLPSPSAAQPPTGSAPSAPSIYVEQGTASWYGLPFHGRRAANGEIFDMNTLVAAHRTLPFGSILRVTNLNNGRQVEVRVIDRGPFVKDRVLDVARAAAIALDMIGTGTAPARIELLSGPTPAVGDFTVQVGAFADRMNAEHLRERLIGTYQPIFIQGYDASNGRYYLVF